MLNQVVLVGRIVKEIELKESENGKKYTNMTIAVPRSFKNVDGVYETDFIDCKLWNVIAENTTEFCKKGDLVGVKGRLQNYTYTTEEEKTQTKTEVVVEKVTFLSQAKKED